MRNERSIRINNETVAGRRALAARQPLRHGGPMMKSYFGIFSLLLICLISPPTKLKQSTVEQSTQAMVTPGWYHIQSKVSGLFLDVYYASQEVGGKIVQAQKHPDQIWQLIPAEKDKNTFYIKS